MAEIAECLKEGRLIEYCAVCDQVIIPGRKAGDYQCRPSSHWICANCMRAAANSSRKMRQSLGALPEEAATAGPDCMWCPFEHCSQTLPLPVAPEPVQKPEELAKVVKLGKLAKASEREMAPIAAAFQTARLGRVIRIMKVQNPVLDAAYAMCRARFRAGNISDAETIVYHGTQRQATGSIIKNGFDASFSGKAHGQVLGPGIYVSPQLSKALEYTKSDSVSTRHVFVCRALFGEKDNHQRKGAVVVLRREQQITPMYLVTCEV